MLEALKKLVGMDPEAAEARKKAAEEERREREGRIANHKEALEKVAKAEKEQGWLAAYSSGSVVNSSG